MPDRDAEIKLSRPYIGDEERRAVLEVLDSGMLAMGPRVAQFEDAFERVAGVRHAVATSSGTTARKSSPSKTRRARLATCGENAL